MSLSGSSSVCKSRFSSVGISIIYKQFIQKLPPRNTLTHHISRTISLQTQHLSGKMIGFKLSNLSSHIRLHSKPYKAVLHRRVKGAICSVCSFPLNRIKLKYILCVYFAVANNLRACSEPSSVIRRRGYVDGESLCMRTIWRAIESSSSSPAFKLMALIIRLHDVLLRILLEVLLLRANCFEVTYTFKKKIWGGVCGGMTSEKKFLAVKNVKNETCSDVRSATAGCL